jgi:DNA-directed RNA polymerase beta subunit
MDPGGYFIVDGKEKVIISQERITTNRLFVSLLKEDPDFYLRGYIQCTGTTGETALSPRTVEIKLVNTSCFFPRPSTFVAKHIDAGTENEKDSFTCTKARVTEEYATRQGVILVSLPSITGMLPMTTVFRALGIESDKDIIETICGPIENVHVSFLNFLRPSLIDGAKTKIFTTEAARENLRFRTYYKSIEQVKSILTIDVFPNIEGSLKEKAIYFGYLISIIMKS